MTTYDDPIELELPAVHPESPTRFVWGHDRLECVFEFDADHPVSLASVSLPGEYVPRVWEAAASKASSLHLPVEPQPLVEILTTGNGHRRASSRLVHTVAGERLRYVDHTHDVVDGWAVLSVRQLDPSTGTEATVTIRSPIGVSSLTVEVTIANTSVVDGWDVSLEAVTVAAVFGVAQPASVDDTELVWAQSDWLAEGRWHTAALRTAGLAELNLAAHHTDAKGAFWQVSTGSWSTEHAMPFGGLVDRRAGTSWIWQVETNGAWRWEVGERRDGAYVALGGPNSNDHQWNRVLAPGERFTTVPVTIAFSVGGFDLALRELTSYRRAARRPHADNSALPIVFNDYMNTLMGDPSTAKLLPLIDAASAVGAGVFVIDAGWYDESGDWWDSVGEWIPSARRFPSGLREVLDRVRALGMTPGLWLEPEVIGVNSPVATTLPHEAFLQRRGIRLREHDRYHLDLRHPAARAHLDEVVDRLVNEYGVGYLKLDYNINAGPGTDIDAGSLGQGLLEHNRAHLAWLDGLLDRHPDLVLENCASGAMRMDAAMLSRLQLQSTSDQQDPLLYPPIAAAAPVAMLPEQAANWAYPQPGMTPEEAAFTLCTAMLGRFYLSGYINQMSRQEQALVAEAVRAHVALRGELSSAHAFWPLGLPGWKDPWIALGMETQSSHYLTLWRRPGSEAANSIPIPALAGSRVQIDVVFPQTLEPWEVEWDASTAELNIVATGPEIAARTFRLTTLD